MGSMRLVVVEVDGMVLPESTTAYGILITSLPTYQFRSRVGSWNCYHAGTHTWSDARSAEQKVALALSRNAAVRFSCSSPIEEGSEQEA